MAGIEEQAQKRFERIVEQMAESEGITEQLKATDQVAWVGEMNNIWSRARAVVNAELILTKLVDCLEKCLIYGHIRRFAN